MNLEEILAHWGWLALALAAILGASIALPHILRWVREKSEERKAANAVPMVTSGDAFGTWLDATGAHPTVEMAPAKGVPSPRRLSLIAAGLALSAQITYLDDRLPRLARDPKKTTAERQPKTRAAA